MKRKLFFLACVLSIVIGSLLMAHVVKPQAAPREAGGSEERHETVQGTSKGVALHCVEQSLFERRNRRCGVCRKPTIQPDFQTVCPSLHVVTEL